MLVQTPHRIALLLVSLCLPWAVGCGAARPGAVEVAAEPEPEPPPPPPEVEPQVWDHAASYRLGWPVRFRAGVVNSGTPVVSVARGELLGVRLTVRRGTEEIACRDLEPELRRGGLLPLATGSSTVRTVALDELCPLDEPGTYSVAVVVELPPIEGGDVSGPQSPVTFAFEVPAPEDPLVGRLVASGPFEVGAPISGTVRLRNHGTEPLRVASASRIAVHLEATSEGETVPCDPPGRGAGSAVATIAPGETLEVPVDLSGRCQLTISGTYSVSARVELPRGGARVFTGSVEAAPALFEVVEPEEDLAPAAGE